MERGSTLAPGQVHVWFITADVDAPLARLLNEEERERAARFRFEDSRRRFTVGRAALRILAARYCGADPRSLAFTTGTHGKPALAAHALELNASHSGDVIALAFTPQGAIGVDIEKLEARHDLLGIGKRFFSPREAARLETASDLEDAFYSIWTAKEAVVKALGEGIGAGLQHFTVPPAPESLTMVDTDNDDLRWCVAALPAPDGYRAAIAAREPALELVVHRALARDLI